LAIFVAIRRASSFVNSLAVHRRAVPKRQEAPIVANQYEELVKLALFCANQARTSAMKDAAREAWRLAIQYRDQAAKFGEPPDIGKKPSGVEEA
jgi:hypothetical protein